eukprot:4986148-Pyramimonas_sp.AAC.1
MEWEDVIVTGETWPAMKPNTKWGQVPVLTTPSGKEMTQSKAMTRYLGKLVSFEGKVLYPECPEAAFDVDEMIDAFEDARMTFVPTFAIQDQAEKEAARAALVAEDGKMTAVLKKIEQFSGDGHVVGDHLTIADIWAFFFLNLLRCGFLDGFPKDYLGQYPKLTAISEKVAAIPAIKEYVDKKVAGGNGIFFLNTLADPWDSSLPGILGTCESYQ